MLLVCVLVVGVASVSEFKNKREFIACVGTCEKVINECLKEMDSACHKAYTSCHKETNFISCLESANGLQMQAISKCMKEECQPVEEEQVHEI